jgi:hypothetical protein
MIQHGVCHQNMQILYREKNSLNHELCPRLVVMPAFGQGKFVPEYGGQGTLDKCTR